MFLKAEIPDIVLVSEGICRELKGLQDSASCLASLQQTYLCVVMFFMLCTLSQPMIGTGKSVVEGLFVLILFHSVRHLQKPVTGSAY